MFESYPTAPGAAREERMSPGFLKLHGGPEPVHIFTKAEDTEFHSHPFAFETHIIEGGYVEEVLVIEPNGQYHVQLVERHPGTSHRVQASTAHRIIALLGPVCVTRANYGPTTQKPGFYDVREDGLWFRFWDEAEHQKLVFPAA